MMIFLRTVGEAVVALGARGLSGHVPMDDKLFEIASDVLRRYKVANRLDELAADLHAVLQASNATIRGEAQVIAREMAALHAGDIAPLVEAYLTQLPAVARQCLKRPNDPSGTTIPNTFDLQDPVQLASLLPRRPPKFKADDPVPHAPQWRFVELLGAGGFGEVWLARHSFLDQRRAFKFCLDPVSRDRLLRHEGEVVKRVMLASATAKSGDHGIVALLDACLEGDAPWLAYEFIDGGDLTAVTRDLAKLPPAERAQKALAILRDLAAVVGHFHRLPQPVIHRDLKPANVLVQKSGDNWLLRITDFGISHIAADRNMIHSMVSTPSMSLGQTFRGAHTPIYSSPQQKRGLKASVRDDVYALGIIGFQLLLADLSAERPSGKWRKRLAECQLPEPLLDFLETCWDDDPAERPEDAQEFVERLTGNSFEKKAPPPAPPVVPTVAIPKHTMALEPPLSEMPAPKPRPPVEPKEAKFAPAKATFNDLWGDIEDDYQAWLNSFRHGAGPRAWLASQADRVARWELAAGQGVSKAMTLMASVYEFGVGRKQNYTEAMAWYRKAADKGDVTAMNELGTYYYHGHGVKTDYAEALRWHRKAALLGNATSMSWVGWMHQDGNGVRKDYVEAMRWYRLAAEAGNATAMYSLGLMYELGNGVKRSVPDAKKWYQQALAAGHEEAREALKGLANS